MTRATPFASVPQAVIALLTLLTAPAIAQDIDCVKCHEDISYTSTAHPDIKCGECHTNVTEAHEGADLEPLTDEQSCNECHGSVARTIGRSVHGGKAGCTGCHGNAHDIREVADLDGGVSPVNQIKNCGGCHDDPPELVEGYLTGEHGKALLLSGLVNAPSCSGCHGSHKIMVHDEDRAPTAHQNSPETCGRCHALLLNDWRDQSAHGLAWQEGREGPVCVDCHRSHRIMDPTTAQAHLASAANCGGCHEAYLTTFRDSFHGKADDLGFATAATCADCHTPHKNLPVDNPASSIHPDNRLETCGKCHDNANAGFVTFSPHNDPTDPNDNFAVYIVWIFMTGLLIGVFAFFGVHDLLWLQRSLVGRMRGEFDEVPDPENRYVRRFRKLNIRMHVVIITTFLLLALTGLPLKFHNAAWAHQLVTLLGGIETTRFLHRLAAIGTFAYAILHLGELFLRIVVRREKGMLWGPNSLMPQPKDVRDFIGNIRYYLYLGPRPQGDRWTYFEKFDYLAVFWGVLIIGFSGLFLWLPEFFTSFLPGWTLNAAYVIHSDEALLATGFIFVFHFFHTHLRPESFPMDTTVFTGKLSLQRFKAERPLEYQRLVENGELESYLVEAPTAEELRRVHTWGSIALTIGVALAIGIIWALLSH